MKSTKKSNKGFRAIAGIGFCVVGFALGLGSPYQSHTFRVDAGGCRLVTEIVEPQGQPASATPQGYVVLFHGLAANKRIMSYITAGFASQGLRVFVPDLPGHGRTDGPFSYDRSEKCSENLVRELVARGLLDPERTILAGHSLGGAIALRVASHTPVAGVIAFSPAPMRPVAGLSPEMMPFHEFGRLPSHTLLMSAAWEPLGLRAGVQDLLSPAGDGTSQYVVIPHSTHVSILFDPAAMSRALDWASSLLKVQKRSTTPSHKTLIGFFSGLAGIFLLAGPFLRESLEGKIQQRLEDRGAPFAKGRVFMECGIVALGTVGVLSYANVLRALHLFEGDYLAGFLLILGTALLLLHWNSMRNLFGKRAAVPREPETQSTRPEFVTILVAAFAALLLYCLVTAWTDLTFSEAWLTAARWARFAPLFIVVLPYHAAEELLLGPAAASKVWQRILTALTFRAIAWGAIVAAIFVLHSGEVLLVLLVPSLFAFCILQTWGMKVVREVTASPTAAAVFGAILLAGFCLVVFPTA